jgi:hypothetical protein
MGLIVFDLLRMTGDIERAILFVGYLLVDFQAGYQYVR